MLFEIARASKVLLFYVFWSIGSFVDGYPRLQGGIGKRSNRMLRYEKLSRSEHHVMLFCACVVVPSWWQRGPIGPLRLGRVWCLAFGGVCASTRAGAPIFLATHVCAGWSDDRISRILLFRAFYFNLLSMTCSDYVSCFLTRDLKTISARW